MTDEDLDRGTFGGSSSSFVREETTAQRFSALQTQLLCAAIHFFHRHIRSDADVLHRMEGNEMFRLFFEVSYHNKPELNRIFPESVHDCSALHVCSFILSILHQGIFSVSAFIVSVIYLSRFKESSRITLHACTWRPLFLTSLLLADKMWEDKPVRNSSLAKLFPVLSNVELNRMESQFLDEIKFNVLVKPDLFCSFCEKLLAEQVHQEISRCVIQSEYAVTLQSESENGKPQAEPREPRAHGANGMSKTDMAEEPERVPVSIHEVPATWMEAMPRGRSQSPTAVRPGPLACDVHFAPHEVPMARVAVVPPEDVNEIFRGAVQQPMRRSLPAKSSTSQYVMLARAPSVGTRAVKVPPGAVPCEANGGHGGHGSMMAVPAHSPRSPTAAMQVQRSHRSQTPVIAQAAGVPVVPHSMGCAQPKPRSSSAPRVSNVYAGGANVRASSQPMQPMVRQVQPTPAVQAQAHAFSGGHYQYGRQADARAASPVMAQMARPVTRSTMGGYPQARHARGTSPGMCLVNVSNVNQVMRGRSPAPMMSQGIRATRAATPTAIVKQIAPAMVHPALGAQIGFAGQ